MQKVFSVAYRTMTPGIGFYKQSNGRVDHLNRTMSQTMST